MILSVLTSLVKPFALPLLVVATVTAGIAMIKANSAGQEAEKYRQKYEQAKAELTVNSLVNAKHKSDLEVSVLQSLNDAAKLTAEVDVLNKKIRSSKRSSTCPEAISRLRDTSDLLLKNRGEK